MRVSTIVVILLIFAWPLYYLYERQLGAVSFLLLAIFFLVLSIKETKKLKAEKNHDSGPSSQEKTKRNNS